MFFKKVYSIYFSLVPRFYRRYCAIAVYMFKADLIYRRNHRQMGGGHSNWTTDVHRWGHFWSRSLKAQVKQISYLFMILFAIYSLKIRWSSRSNSQVNSYSAIISVCPILRDIFELSAVHYN